MKTVFLAIALLFTLGHSVRALAWQIQAYVQCEVNGPVYGGVLRLPNTQELQYQTCTSSTPISSAMDNNKAAITLSFNEHIYQVVPESLHFAGQLCQQKDLYVTDTEASEFHSGFKAIFFLAPKKGRADHYVGRIGQCSFEAAN